MRKCELIMTGFYLFIFNVFLCSYSLVCFAVLGIKPRALGMPGKRSGAELFPLP
jgi:hypothetical protein